MTHVHKTGDVRIRRLALVLAIVSTLMVVEAVGGFLTGSLTLLADAGHMLSDAGGLGLALFAVWFARRPSPPRQTFGYQRAEILAALVNALLLTMVTIFVVREALSRLRHPEDVQALPMFLIGCLGLVGNLVAMRILRQDARENLNIRGAYLEVMADLLASFGVLIAAVLTGLFGWQRADPILSLGVALFILPRIAHLLRETTDVLMEAAPRGMEMDDVRQLILAQPGVAAVHDLHVWTITSGRTCLSAHVVGSNDINRDHIIVEINRALLERFGIGHTTLQVEGEGHSDFSGQRSAELCDPCTVTEEGERIRPAALPEQESHN